VRILVTGATGFLGFHLCERLVSRGDEVTAFHRQQSRTARLEALGIRRVQGELRDLSGLRSAVSGQDAVIHAAADVRYWVLETEEQDQVNVSGTRNIAQACRLEGTRRMLHVSSMSAIGIPPDALHPADETFEFNLQGGPLTYNRSKKRAEEAVFEEVAKGLDAVIVNPASVFGPHGSSYRLGEVIRKVARGWIVPYFTGGICTVHVADVVEGMLAALDRGIRGDRYILGGENLSYREIARRSLEAQRMRRPLVPLLPAVTPILAALMAPVGRIRGQPPRFNPANLYTSSRFQYYLSDKARRELGYAPRGFDAIVEECLGIVGASHSGIAASLVEREESR